MTLWLILTLMIATAAVLVSAPFIRRFERGRLQAAGDVAIAVYRDQLKEVDREAALGAIEADQAEAARSEIKRRLLAADRAGAAAPAALSTEERKFAIVAVPAIIVLGSVGLYALTGHPEEPALSSLDAADSELAELSQGPSAREARARGSRSAPAATRAVAQPQSQSSAAPVDEMIQRLAARLQRSPEDAEGWRTLGWSYFNTERFADAAEAYGKAVALNPDSAELRSAHGEALIRAADGVVTAEAKRALDETLKLDPKDARTRFFVGLAKEQAGDKAGALQEWTETLGDANPREPWIADLEQRIAELSAELGTGDEKNSLAAVTPTVASPRASERSPAVGSIATGPDAADIRNAEAMAPADRAAMIRGMVERLATRLEQSPRDPEGWIRLIRSRAVLGEREAAKETLARALKIFDQDAGVRAQIIAAARQLSLAE